MDGVSLSIFIGAVSVAFFHTLLGADHTLRFWDVQTGKQIRNVAGTQIQSRSPVAIHVGSQGILFAYAYKSCGACKATIIIELLNDDR